MKESLLALLVLIRPGVFLYCNSHFAGQVHGRLERKMGPLWTSSMKPPPRRPLTSTLLEWDASSLSELLEWDV